MASGKTRAPAAPKALKIAQPPVGPEIIILVGGNGSGKSTYFDLYLKDKGLPFINADLIAKANYGEEAQAKSLEAAKIAEDTRYRLLDMRQSFCFETVFSHPSKVDFLAHAKASGFLVKMIAIYTDSPALNVARVSQRVSAGGHSVPEQKILDRIARTHENIGSAIPLCDQFVLLDNSSSTQPFVLKLAITGGQCQFKHEALPTFAIGCV